MLCAIVNNNVRCYNESMEFAERVEDTLDDDHKVHLISCFCLEIASMFICELALLTLSLMNGSEASHAVP